MENLGVHQTSDGALAPSRNPDRLRSPALRGKRRRLRACRARGSGGGFITLAGIAVTVLIEVSRDDSEAADQVDP
jgi:hypothetical protein